MVTLTAASNPAQSAESARRRADLSQALHGALERSDNMLLLLEHRGGALAILAANEQAQHTTGFAEDALIGRALTALTGPETDPATLDAVLAAARDGRPQHAQLKCRTQSGQDFWFDLHLMPADDRDGGRRSVILGHDVTAKLRVHQQEAAVQSLLAKVFVTVEAPVYILDLQGRFLMTNPAFDRVVGVSPGSLAGKTVLDYYTPETAAAIAACRRQQDVDGRNYNLEVVLRTATGERPGRMTGVMVQRPDLARFRIITVNMHGAATAAAPPPVRITAAGKLQLIGLEAVRESLGDRWPTVAERAMAMAEHVIRRRLGPLETFSRSGDAGFAVCFAGCTEEEAAFRAAGIGRELRAKLVGEGEMAEAAHVASAVLEVPPGAQYLPSADLNALVQSRLNERLRAAKDTARTRLHEALRDLNYETEPVRARGRAGPMGDFVRLPRAADLAIHTAMGVLPSAETERLDLDAVLLGFAGAFAMEDALRGGTGMVFVTLSGDVLQARSRLEACVAFCRTLDEALRQRLVLLVAIQPGTATIQAAAALGQLRPVCRFAGAAIETLDSPLDTLALGLKIQAIDVRRLVVLPAWESRLRAFAAAMRAQKCRLIATGARTPAEAEALFGAGVELVSGR